MKKINAEIICDSMSPQGHRITTFILTFPRFILAELNTHRMFSKNSASSRAIPFEKMIKMVDKDPFIPIAWQKDHKGMQGTEYFIDFQDIEDLEKEWLFAKEDAVNSAISMNSRSCTKQLVNRLLEPFMWHTVLLTATEFENFFELRCPKYYFEPEKEYFKSKKDYAEAYKSYFDCEEMEGFYNETEWRKVNSSQAEIHIQALAEAMWDAYNESVPKQLQAGEWHIPFGDKFKVDELSEEEDILDDTLDRVRIKIATARCARLSYMNFDEEIDYKKDIQLHDNLLKSHHMSPFEHCAKAPTDKEYYSIVKGKIPTLIDKYGITNLEMMPVSSGDPIVGFKGINPNNGNKYGWFNNFRGWIQYRYLIENKQYENT